MRTWLLRPSLSLPILKSRHDAVSCFMMNENLLTVDTLQGHLKGIKNVPRILGILRMGRAKMADWQTVVKVMCISCQVLATLLTHWKFTFHCAMLKDSLAELHDGSRIEVVRTVQYGCLRETMRSSVI
jgi:DNA mismatch repair protein MSH5